LSVSLGLVALLVACSGLTIDIRTDPARVDLPVLGSSVPLGTLTVYAEKYLPLNDVPESKSLVRFKEIKVSWKDSANIEAAYEIWFSSRGNVAADPDSTKLYVELKCTSDTATCNIYRGALQSLGYVITDTPVDLSFRKLLLDGQTSPGEEQVYERYLPDEAVALMDTVVENRGMYVLVRSVLLVPSVSDTIRIKDLMMDIKAEFK